MAAHHWHVLAATKGLDQRQQPTTDGAQGYALEAENLGFGQAGALVMRLGSAMQSLASSGITGVVEWMGKFVTNAGVEERWAASNNAGTANLARRASGSWNSVSFSDTVAVADLRYMSAAALNGLYAVCYNSDVNRAHVWDGTALRRMGIDKPAAPTAADLGSGAGAIAARMYRIQYLIVSGSDIVAASELSSASSPITPVGADTIRVTKSTTVDSATHWRVYAIAGSTDTYDLYKLISGNIVVATTTYDDTVDPAAYSGDAPAELGQNIPPPSAKYVIEDGERFIFAGAHEASGTATQTAPKQNRVWYTPPLGAADIGDSERIPSTATQKNRIDIGDAGPITGLALLEGIVYVFKADSVWKLLPTGDLTRPYRRRRMTNGTGAIDQRCVLMAENSEGVPCIYFASRTGVYQILGGAIRDVSEAARRDLRLNAFSAAASLLGWQPHEKTLYVQTAHGTAPAVGQYRQFIFDVAQEKWSGASYGPYQAGWILGRSVLGVDTTLTDQSFVRCALTALDDDGIPRLLLGGQTSDPDAEGSILSYGAQGGLDGTHAFTARGRWRLPLGVKEGRQFTVYAPTVVYRNPVGSESVTTTLTLTYRNDAGLESSDAVTLTATDANDPLGQQRVTVEGMTLADCFVVDVRVQVACNAAFEASTVPVAIDAIWVPYELKQEVAA